MFVSPMFDMFLAIMGKLNQVGANIMASMRILLSLSAIAESSEMWGFDSGKPLFWCAPLSGLI